jgi:hypothetical protein
MSVSVDGPDRDITYPGLEKRIDTATRIPYADRVRNLAMNARENWPSLALFGLGGALFAASISIGTDLYQEFRRLDTPRETHEYLENTLEARSFALKQGGSFTIDDTVFYVIESGIEASTDERYRSERLPELQDDLERVRTFAQIAPEDQVAAELAELSTRIEDASYPRRHGNRGFSALLTALASTSAGAVGAAMLRVENYNHDKQRARHAAKSALREARDTFDPYTFHDYMAYVNGLLDEHVNPVQLAESLESISHLAQIYDDKTAPLMELIAKNPREYVGDWAIRRAFDRIRAR